MKCFGHVYKNENLTVEQVHKGKVNGVRGSRYQKSYVYNGVDEILRKRWMRSLQMKDNEMIYDGNGNTDGLQ